MKDKEYIELFKIWFPTKARMTAGITREDFAKEYHIFKKRFQAHYNKLDKSFVGNVPR